MSQDIQTVRLISGPYRATKLWNAAVRAFHGGMPTSRHRRGLRVFEDCFTGSEATAWLHQHLTTNPNFGSSVTQEQATTLFKKFLKSGLLEDAVSGATAVQLKEKGLYRFSSVSPLRALRTPGRHSTSDLRASTRRLQAAQQQAASVVSPPLQDAKAVVGDATSPVSGHYVSVPRSRNLLHQRPYNDRQQPGRQSGRESYRRLSHEAAIANARDHQNKQQQNIKQNHPSLGSGYVEKENNWRNLNNVGGDGQGKLNKTSSGNRLTSLGDDKENVGSIKGAGVIDERLRSKVERLEGPSDGGEDALRYFKRPALRAIENTTGGGPCNSLVTQASDTAAAFRNTNYKDKLHSNVYIPLGEVVRFKNSRDSSKDITSKQDDKFKTELNPKQHNAINTMSEFNGEKNGNNDLDVYKTENHCNDKKSRSRVKSFLIKSSGNSKYHHFIPKFGVDTTTSTSNKVVSTTSMITSYANSKTISPKLLHAVTATVPSGQPNPKALPGQGGIYQSIDTLRRKSQENTYSGGFAVPKVPERPTVSQFIKPTTAAGESRYNSVKKVSKSDLAPMKFTSGSSIASAASTSGGSQSNLLATFVGNMAMEPRLEQAYIEAWLQILDGGVCGTPLSLPSSLVHGPTLLHNQQRVTPRGVVHVDPGHPDDLPHWLLAAMRFLAHWPSSHSEGREEGGSIPNYPGVEADVYRMVRDYFVHQTTPVIPSAVATALLEVLSAVEFLDLTFRDPRHRFGNSSSLSGKLNNKNTSLDTLSQLNPKQRRSFVDLQALEDDCCEGSVFATLPRASKKSFRGNDSFNVLNEDGRLSASDSVEDLMLNMSIAGQQGQQNELLRHSNTRNNTEARGDLNNSCSASPEPQSLVISNADRASITRRSVCSGTVTSCQSSPYPSQASLGSSNVFLDDVLSATNQHRSNSRHNSIPETMRDQESSFQSRESEESSRNSSMENPLGNLTQLSSTNISHIEHFNKSSTGAVYVTGDDVRRRKKKRRFFSRASKKKKNWEGIENYDRTTPDLRRYSVYECLPLASDVSGSSEGAGGYSRPGSSVELRDAVYHQNGGGHDVYSVVKPIASYGPLGKACANTGPYRSVSNPSLHSDSNTIHAVSSEEYPLTTHQKKLSQGMESLFPEPASLVRNGIPNVAKSWVSGAPSWSDASAQPPSSTTSDARAQLLRSTDIDHVALPPNSCFETAFTSDSPKTRIIPQKSVDTLHLRQLKRRRKSGSTLGQPRPKSIAVPQHCAARFTEMADHQTFHSYGSPADGHGSLSCLGSPSSGQDTSRGKHYWNNSPSMFEISSPYRPLSVADLATEPRSLQTQPCGVAGGSEGPMDQLRPRAVSVLADTSFNRSRSTGDLNVGGQAWPSEQRLVNADSSSGHFSVDTTHKGSAGALTSMSSRGLSLVNRVRDSIRRRKGGNKDATNTSSSSVVASRKRHRSRKGNASATGADSSNGDNTSGCHSINSSCVSTNASYHNGGRELKSSEGSVNPSLPMECQRRVQYAKVINAERGIEVHQQNVQTLRRLRTLSGGFTNPCLSLSPSAGNQCNNTVPKSTSQEGSVISPIIGCPASGPGLRELSTPCVKPSLLSPFTPSSGGGDTMDIASIASFSDHRSCPDSVESRPSSSCCSSEAFTSAQAAPSFSHRSSVTTTNYNTHLSTHYARNHYRNQPGSTDSTTATPIANNRLAEGTRQPCFNHFSHCSGDDSRRAEQHLSTSRAVMSTPVSALESSRSPSLSSLYTTALACYDESDPQPFGLTQLTTDAGGAADTPVGNDEASSPLAQENSQIEYECMKKKISESPCSCCNSFTKLKTSRDCSSSNNSSGAVSALRCKQTANDSRDHSSDCNHDSCCSKTSASVDSINENQTAAGSVGRLRNVTNNMGEAVTSSGGLKRSCGRSSWHDSVPRVHTEEGTARLLSCVQLLLLLLQPVARRRLHLLLRLLHKMSNNTHLDLNSIGSKAVAADTLDATRCHKQEERCSKACDVSDDSGVAASPLPHNCNHCKKACDARECCKAQQQEEELLVSTRDRVLSELGWCILRGCTFNTGGASSDEASCRRLLRLLVDQHQTLLRPSPELDDATAHRLKEALCFPSQQQARSENKRSATTTAATTAVAAGLCDRNEGIKGSTGTRRYSDEPVCEISRTALTSEGCYSNANNMNILRCPTASAGMRHVRFDDDTSNCLTLQTGVQKVMTDSSQQTDEYLVNARPGSIKLEDTKYGSVFHGSGHDEAFLVPDQEPPSQHLPPNSNPRLTEYGHPGPMPADGIKALSYQRRSSTSHFPVRYDDGLPFRPRLPSPSPPPPYPCTDRTTTCNNLPHRTTGSNDVPNSRRPLSVAFNHSTHGANFQGVNNETYYYMSNNATGGQEYDRLRRNTTSAVSYAKGCSVAPSTGHPSQGVHASTGQGLSYCVQVAPSEWEQQRCAEQQQQHLQTLLQQIVQDASSSDRDKKTRVKQFAAVHPNVYHTEVLNIPPHLRCSDGGAPVKKRGMLRGMMKLASLSSLSRNKHATKP